MKSRFLTSMVCILCASGIVATAAAQQFPEYGDALYQPRLRQSGKDVIWLPTPDAMVMRMLQAAKVTEGDLVYDLGAGDGKIPIAAAKYFGARAVGIEYNAELAALGRRNAQRAGVAARVDIIQGDIFQTDFSSATVVTLYLLPDLNHQLRPTLLAMKPGTRIVSHQWHMGEWEPDEVIRDHDTEAFLWVVPAPVAGRWTLREKDDINGWQATVEFVQQFQRLGGSITVNGVTRPLLGAYVSGANIGFTFVAADGSTHSMRATIAGRTMSGTLRFVDNLTPVVGERP